MAEKQIFTKASKKKQPVSRKAVMAIRMEDINRTIVKAIASIQAEEIDMLAELVDWKGPRG